MATSTLTKSSEPTKTLEVRDVSIKTASIEVKALTLNNKQITLSVFRQIQEERIVNEDNGDLHGIPWGMVNYCPNGAKCFDEKHFHIVWQKGSELRRDTIIHRNYRYSRGVNKSTETLGRITGCLIAKAVLENDIRHLSPYVLEHLGRRRRHDSLTSKLHGIEVETYLPESVSEWYCYQNADFRPWNKTAEELEKACRDSFLSLEKEMTGIGIPSPLTEVPIDTWLQFMNSRAKTTHELIQKFKSQYAAHEALDQLFIAV